MKYSPKPLLLFFPFGLLSHYLRCLVLAKYLSPYFRIKFACHRRYDAFVTAEGFGTFQCPGMDEAVVMAGAREFSFSWLNQNSLEETMLSQIRAIAAHNPAAVFGDASPSLKMAAEYCGVPFVSLINNYMSRYYTGTRHLPENHPLARLLTLTPPAMRDSFTRVGESVAFKKIHKPFAALRHKYMLKPCGGYLEEQEGDLTLVCDAPEVFPLSNCPESFIPTGPLIYDATGLSCPFSLAALSSENKTIFVSMGSTGEWQKVSFLNRAEYGRYNIVAAGDTAGVLHAAHVTHVDFVAARDILPFTNLVICHGGNGTIYQSLLYGVPVLCSSTHFEQEWNVKAFSERSLAGALENLSTPGAYERIIDDWTTRKGCEPLRSFRELLLAGNARLPGIITEVAGKIAAMAGAVAIPTPAAVAEHED